MLKIRDKLQILGSRFEILFNDEVYCINTSETFWEQNMAELNYYYLFTLRLFNLLHLRWDKLLHFFFQEKEVVAFPFNLYRIHVLDYV